jgi:hypothetical protein
MLFDYKNNYPYELSPPHTHDLVSRGMRFFLKKAVFTEKISRVNGAISFARTSYVRYTGLYKREPMNLVTSELPFLRLYFSVAM